MLIYVKYLSATDTKGERFSASPVTDDLRKRKAFRVTESYDHGLTNVVNAYNAAVACSSAIGAWERDVLKCTGEARVSLRPCGEDADGWYFLRLGVYSAEGFEWGMTSPSPDTFLPPQA